MTLIMTSMRPRTKIGLALAVAFALFNLYFVVYAAVRGEVAHALAHVALTVLGAWLAQRLLTKQRRQDY